MCPFHHSIDASLGAVEVAPDGEAYVSTVCGAVADVRSTGPMGGISFASHVGLQHKLSNRTSNVADAVLAALHIDLVDFLTVSQRRCLMQDYSNKSNASTESKTDAITSCHAHGDEATKLNIAEQIRKLRMKAKESSEQRGAKNKSARHIKRSEEKSRSRSRLTGSRLTGMTDELSQEESDAMQFNPDAGVNNSSTFTKSQISLGSKNGTEMTEDEEHAAEFNPDCGRSLVNTTSVRSEACSSEAEPIHTEMTDEEAADLFNPDNR